MRGHIHNWQFFTCKIIGVARAACAPPLFLRLSFRMRDHQCNLSILLLKGIHWEISNFPKWLLGKLQNPPPPPLPFSLSWIIVNNLLPLCYNFIASSFPIAMRSVIQTHLPSLSSGRGGWGGGLESESCTVILLLNIVLFYRFAVCNFDALSIWNCFPRTLIIEPNIRDHFPIIVLTCKPPPKKNPKQTNKNKTKTVYNMSVNGPIRG